MTSHTLQLTNGTRTWTSQELAQLSFQLSASGQVWPKDSSVVIKRLDDRGRLLISQTDHYYPGQRLHELYDIDHDPTVPFALRFSLKNQWVFVSLSEALGDCLGASGGASERLGAPGRAWKRLGASGYA